jgi:hypothetical protein
MYLHRACFFPWKFTYHAPEPNKKLERFQLEKFSLSEALYIFGELHDEKVHHLYIVNGGMLLVYLF